MCVSIHFTSLFRSWLNACHPPSPLLFSVPLLSIRLPRLWTILCPVSVVLGQPALRAARKVMFTPRTQSTFVRCSCCFNLYNSQLHLSPPLRFRGAARACSFSVSVHSASLKGRSWETHRVEGFPERSWMTSS